MSAIDKEMLKQALREILDEANANGVRAEQQIERLDPGGRRFFDDRYRHPQLEARRQKYRNLAPLRKELREVFGLD